MKDTLFVLGLAAATLLVIWASDVIGRRRVQRWCDRQGFDLLEWRGATAFEGPREWRRTENVAVYCIEVRGRDGYARAGHLKFGSTWNPFSRAVEVEWQ